MRSALAALSADGDSGERLSRTAFGGIARLRCRRSATLFASHSARKNRRDRTRSGKSLFARRLRGDGTAVATVPVDDRDFTTRSPDAGSPARSTHVLTTGR
jgi:hypothetical protein